MKWDGKHLICAVCLGMCIPAYAGPRVVIPDEAKQPEPAKPLPPNQRILYPWKQFVMTSVFWVGESKEASKSGECFPWDPEWKDHFGGIDDPEPKERIADAKNGEFRSKAFVPKLNPFYIALPYNDLINGKDHQPDADRFIPWAARIRKEPGKSRCKGRWVQIYSSGKSCYGQWEASGPSLTDDWEFVFGDKPPKQQEQDGAGIAVSPAIRDYLELKPGQQVHWRFVEAGQVPYGPWKKHLATEPDDPDVAAQKRYLEYLKKKRNESARQQEEDTRKKEASPAKPDAPPE